MQIQDHTRLSPAQRWALLGIMLCFGLLFASVSLVNHHYFRTSALDLAYYNQAIYDYSEFRYNYHTLSNAPFVSTLGDHWEPILMVVAPLRYIFGNTTLLWLQIFAALFGGLGVFRFIRSQTARPWLPHLALLHFFAMWGIWSAISFDFHASVLGAMFMPWILVFFAERKMGWAIGMFVLFAMCAEKMALWGFFIGLALALMYMHDRKRARIALALGLISLIYFVLTIKFFIPAHIRPNTAYRHAKFSNLGDGYGEMLTTLITRPGYVISLFWTNIFPDKPQYDSVKIETLKMIFLSGGLALLLRPRYLIIFLPLLGMNMLGEKASSWSINMHYSVEYMPVLSIALFVLLARLRSPRWAVGLGIFAFVLAFSSTLISFSTRYKPNYVRERTDFTYGKHWRRDEFKVSEVHEMLALIPPKVNVAASAVLAPHLSMRDSLFMFPRYQQCDYVIVMQDHHTYPLSKKRTHEIVDMMLNSGNWEALGEKSRVKVMKRKIR